MSSITTTERAERITDLLDGEFRIVAERKRGEAEWIYSLPESDIAVFHRMVGHHEIVSVQRREPTEAYVVLAKLARAS